MFFDQILMKKPEKKKDQEKNESFSQYIAGVLEIKYIKCRPTCREQRGVLVKDFAAESIYKIDSQRAENNLSEDRDVSGHESASMPEEKNHKLAYLASKEARLKRDV